MIRPMTGCAVVIATAMFLGGKTIPGGDGAGVLRAQQPKTGGTPEAPGLEVLQLRPNF